MVQKIKITILVCSLTLLCWFAHENLHQQRAKTIELERFAVSTTAKIIVDANTWHIVDINNEACDLLEESRLRLLGRNISYIIPEKHKEQHDVKSKIHVWSEGHKSIMYCELKNDTKVQITLFETTIDNYMYYVVFMEECL